MRKLKWIVPVMVGMLSMAVFAQKAQAGIAAVVCYSGDAEPQSNELKLVYVAASSEARTLTEGQAKAEAMSECSREGCTRCDHVCSGEGTLFMAISYKLFGNAWVTGCSIERAPRGSSQTIVNSLLGPRNLEVAVNRCENYLRNLNDMNSCERARPKYIYHQEPQDRAFVGHVY